MATRPFFVVVQIVLTANGQNSGEYDVGQGNTFNIQRIQQKSTGAFDIVDISDNFGNRYTNASISEPIGGNIFTDIDTDNNNPADLTNSIVIQNNGKIQFTVLDTSGSSNTVSFFLQGLLEN